MLNRLASSLFVVLAVLTAPVSAQVAPAPAAVQAAISATSNYLVGPADVLSIKVFDEPSLSANYNVDHDGTITFPFLGRVGVKGKTLREIEEALTQQLREGIINRAQVSVEIATYRSRAIYVLGEVRSPGKYNIEGQATLLEVIAKAGSFTPAAGPTLIVQRYKDGMAAAIAAAPAQPNSPDTAELLRVDIEDLKQGRFASNVLLQDSDTIIVPAAERYYVTGFVRTPGSFVLRPGMTIQQAIAEAGGITERGSTRGIKVTRKVNNKDVEIEVSMSDLVRPNDTIRVRQRLI
ncbi:MAG TPA: polysaccharide biosynthesis/export family protein [Vicinamibacterales bacterium]|nr:polysaccharide biosynthesis/export family protein [Vicinamibacterales bacterium]